MRLGILHRLWAGKVVAENRFPLFFLLLFMCGLFLGAGVPEGVGVGRRGIRCRPHMWLSQHTLMRSLNACNANLISGVVARADIRS